MTFGLISGEFRCVYANIGTFTEAVLNAVGGRFAGPFPGGVCEWRGNELSLYQGALEVMERKFVSAWHG